jgi:hypothetical protein
MPLRTGIFSILILGALLAGSGCATRGPSWTGMQAEFVEVRLNCGLHGTALRRDAKDRRLLHIVFSQRNDERATAIRDGRMACAQLWAEERGYRLSGEGVDDTENEETPMIQDLPPAPPAIISIKRVDPSESPSISIAGQKQRLVSLAVRGEPGVIAEAKRRVEDEGWTIDVVSQDGKVMQIDATLKTVEQAAMLYFRIANGDFGALKVNAFLVRDREDER